jgi:hypothetical protein
MGVSPLIQRLFQRRPGQNRQYLSVLVYSEPYLEQPDDCLFRAPWLRHFIHAMVLPFVAKAQQEYQAVTVECIYSEVLDTQTDLRQCFGHAIHFAAIPQAALDEIFADFDTYNRQKQQDDLPALRSLIQQHTRHHHYDVVLLVSTFANYLTPLYPNSLFLMHESGIFSRQPYPATLYFEVGTSMHKAFITRHHKRIRKKRLTPAEQQFVLGIQSYFQSYFQSFNPAAASVAQIRPRYRSVVVLALQPFDSDMCRSSCLFTSQFAFITHVFNAMPADVGIIVTEHPIDNPITGNPTVKAALMAQYPNCIVLDDLTGCPSVSQYLLPLVDGVITVSSTVGLQALLFDKVLIVPAPQSYMAAFADVVNNFADVPKLLHHGPKRPKTALLYWLLAHYTINDAYFLDPDWFFAFIMRSMQTRGLKRNAAFYAQIDTLDRLQAVLCRDALQVDAKFLVDTWRASKGLSPSPDAS